jgi:type IV pilus biogenesis protein CpaD/CtpE
MGAAAMKRSLVLAIALAALAGCGSRDDLRPVSAEKTPQRPAMAARAPTTDELLTPPPIAQPQRQDDGLSRSQERKDDRFDMPPT